MTKKASKKSKTNIFSVFDDRRTPPKNFRSIGYMVQNLPSRKVLTKMDPFLVKNGLFFLWSLSFEIEYLNILNEFFDDSSCFGKV
jgi:hypothetical protein